MNRRVAYFAVRVAVRVLKYNLHKHHHKTEKKGRLKVELEVVAVFLQPLFQRFSVYFGFHCGDHFAAGANPPDAVVVKGLG
jgi:hypothetical protein